MILMSTMIEPEIVIERHGRFDWLYEVSGFRKVNTRAFIVPGFHLYEVKAHYASWLPPNSYYVAAINKREAKERFLGRFSWLDVITNIEPLSDEVSELILSESSKHIIF